MQVLTITIKNRFNQKERREARVVRSAQDLPVGLGRVGEAGGHLIFAERSLENLEYAKLIYAIKK